MLVGKCVAVDFQPDGLFFPVRAHAVIRDRRIYADCGKPEVWTRSNSTGGVDRVFPPLPPCAFPVGCAGVGGYWYTDRNSCRMGHEKGEQRQSPKIRNLLTAYAPVQTFTFS